ncbi:MAG: 50S ribosomal protein L9, partial [Prevotella sp.]|nr:50S ribosomal protein L9 [Prevotella sp.]
GEYAATAVFHKEVKVEIPVTVLAEGNPAGVKAEAKAEAAQEAPVEAPAEEAPAATEEAAE